MQVVICVKGMIPIARPIVEEEEIASVKQVLESGMLAEGKVSREFEQKFRDYIGSKFATVTNNGTTALSTAIDALEIKPGDEVITTPFTFIASANTIAIAGAIPVFVDVKKDTYNIDPELVEKAKKIKVINRDSTTKLINLIVNPSRANVLKLPGLLLPDHALL